MLCKERAVFIGIIRTHQSKLTSLIIFKFLETKYYNNNSNRPVLKFEFTMIRTATSFDSTRTKLCVKAVPVPTFSSTKRAQILGASILQKSLKFLNWCFVLSGKTSSLLDGEHVPCN